MYIKSIILEGYKSFRERVEIKGFDSDFTAITDQNARGKSDILEAIHFVLGAADTSKDKSFHELIRFNEMARINKTSVTIILDNTNRSQRPIEYTSSNITVTREVVRGRRNKYLINGISVLKSRVTSLFCPVNIILNQPYFLITQETINKLLAMTDYNMLRMVEVMAGSNNFEATRTFIDKQDVKLAALCYLLTDKIAPLVKQLEADNEKYKEKSKLEEELKSIQKLHQAKTFLDQSERSRELQDQIEYLNNYIQAISDNKTELQKKIKNIDEEVAKINEMIIQGRDKKQELAVVTEMADCSRDVERLLTQKEQYSTAVGIFEQQILEMETDEANLRAKAIACQNICAHMIAKKPWITIQRDTFGVAGGEFDFAAKEYIMSDENISDVVGQLNRVRKELKPDVPNTLRKTKQQRDILIAQLEIVLKERSSMISAVNYLDQKRIMVESTCLIMNPIFESIFSMLLPGGMARLVLLRTETELTGLQVNVGFNGTWMKSLDELSAEQRSLMALSLVLTVHKMQKSPLCILGMVDTALNISQSKSFRQILRCHFEHLQFIAISLKSGMFNNANVLIQAYKEDDKSTISRSVYQPNK